MTSTSDWTLNGKPFGSDQIGEFIGFVYLITDTRNGKKYIGKKLFVSRKTLPPLKGKKRKRVKLTESDWKEYFGSSDEVKTILEEHGRDIFVREILHLCHTKGELSYMEAKEQFEREVLLRDDYYNGIINCKIHRTHVKKLKKDC